MNSPDIKAIALADNGISDDEFYVLMIAAGGNSMIPIGRWEQPVKALAERGLMCRIDSANYVITNAGREAIKQRDKQDDQELRAALKAGHWARDVQENIQAFVEDTAQKLARAAGASAKITGDSHERTVKRWGDEIVLRALELMGN